MCLNPIGPHSLYRLVYYKKTRVHAVGEIGVPAVMTSTLTRQIPNRDDRMTLNRI